MTVYEADLPGVGKKHEIEIGDGTRLVVVTHNTGKREVYRREDPNEDATKLFELSDRLARQVGTILEGAYFQPVRSEAIETMLGEGIAIEWVSVVPESPLVGRTLAASRLRQEVGVSVIAIQRGDEVIENPDGETEIRAEDTLVVLGSREACRSLDAYVTPGDGNGNLSLDDEDDGSPTA
jgi:TrkA domain protein